MVFWAKLNWKWGKKKWMKTVIYGERQTIRWWFARWKLIDVSQQSARSNKSYREGLCSILLSYPYSKGSEGFMKRIRISFILEVSFLRYPSWGILLEVSFFWPENDIMSFTPIPYGFSGISPPASSVYLFLRQIKDDPSLMYKMGIFILFWDAVPPSSCDTSNHQWRMPTYSKYNYLNSHFYVKGIY